MCTFYQPSQSCINSEITVKLCLQWFVFALLPVTATKRKKNHMKNPVKFHTKYTNLGCNSRSISWEKNICKSPSHPLYASYSYRYKNLLPALRFRPVHTLDNISISNALLTRHFVQMPFNIARKFIAGVLKLTLTPALHPHMHFNMEATMIQKYV